MLSQHQAAKCFRSLCRTPLVCLRRACQWLHFTASNRVIGGTRLLCPENSKASISLGSCIFTYSSGIILFALVRCLPAASGIYLIGVLLVPLMFVFIFLCPFLRLLVAMLLGVFWAAWHGLSWQQQRLPESLEAKVVSVSGQVVGLPVDMTRLWRFDFRPDEDSRLPVNHLRLSWYGGPEMQPGERWQFEVKLRRPRGSHSPGAFDYEARAARENLRATGYVIRGERLKSYDYGLMAGRDRLRQSVRNRVYALLNSETSGLLVALMVGDKSGITPEQWRLLNQSGTTHLMVISGLHIGLMTAFGFWLLTLLGRLGFLPLRYCPLPRLAALAGLGLAFSYAFLAGLSIPVQRALVMSGVALSGHLFGVRAKPSTLFVLALAAVLTMTPLASTSVGFWYSFLAVAALLYGFAGRIGGNSRWRRWGQPQWVVFLLLMPTLLFHGQDVSLLSPLVNLVAIPLIAGIVVPLALLSLVLNKVYASFSDWLLIALDRVLQVFMLTLDWLNVSMPDAVMLNGQGHQLPALLLALGAGLLILSPVALQVRRLAPLLALPWLFPRQELIGAGHAVVSVLDVGQGLSVLVRTHSHAVLYDTGDVYASGFSMAERVVIPYIQHKGVKQLDRVVISHGDRDHAGGLQAVMEKMPSAEVWTGTALPDFSGHVHACQPGLSWEWDQVRFEFLAGSGSWSQGNDRSCILKITANQQALLLTGDVSQRVERMLVSQNVNLQADYLLLPHHGSKYSGSEGFLRQVSPGVVLISAGYKNRFGHPAAETVARIESLGAEIINTAQSGTLEFVLGDVVNVSGSRRDSGRYWHQP